MSTISNKHLKLLSKIFLANMLNNIELDNDTSKGKEFKKITDEDTFDAFVKEFNNQSNRLIKQLEKELGFDMPQVQTLNSIFELAKTLKNKDID